MKVILLKDVGGVGRVGEVKEVSDGHALNMLIPRGLAEQATKERLKTYEAEQKKRSDARAKEAAALAALVKSVENARIELRERATEKGGLFKTVGSKEIADAIAKQKGVHIPPEYIAIKEPIKTVGEHAVEIAAAGATARLVAAITAV